MRSLAIVRYAVRLPALSLLLLTAAQCGPKDGGTDLGGQNPFLESQGAAKGDTGYLNLAGLEAEVTLEADVKAPASRVVDAPLYLAQFAVTYLRRHGELYLQILAADETAPDRVEWLVDGKWIAGAEARSLAPDKLTHFRMTAVNAVMLNGFATHVFEGQVLKAKVPVEPYRVMEQGGESCGDVKAHTHLSQSTYWYLWTPDKEGCTAPLQDMTVTVDKLLPRNSPSYPEYDQLWADGELTAVVVFGQLDGGSNVKTDWNWQAADRFVTWLEAAGFAEQERAPLGRRFAKTAGDRKETIDVYHPGIFNDVADYAHLASWQRAVSEHEVVVYLGHSVLGTGSAFEQISYPPFYQVMFIGGCLGYEYYVLPVLKGKGGWDKVDVVSSILENEYGELNDAAGTFLARLMSGFEQQGAASWQDIMAAVNTRIGHAHFGVSGARGNCFSPDGRVQCGQTPAAARVYGSKDSIAIPDGDAGGIGSTIVVPDSFKVGSMTVALDITHDYVGDLTVTLSHAGTTFAMRDQNGGAQKDVKGRFSVDAFRGLDAAGAWVLHLVDNEEGDTGTLDSWALEINPQ